MRKPLAEKIQSAKSMCPVRIVLDQFSDRWAIQAVFALKAGPIRFNALRRELNGITQKVLGQTLQRLNKNGHVVTSKPIAVEYSLSELGTSLLPLVEQLRLWAISHEADLTSARDRHEALLDAI